MSLVFFWSIVVKYCVLLQMSGSKTEMHLEKKIITVNAHRNWMWILLLSLWNVTISRDLYLILMIWRQHGQVVSASDVQSSSSGFESRSGDLLDLFSVVPSSADTLVNSQLVASCQLGFLILLCCIWIICF